MRFEDALKAMREGAKIRRPHWNEGDHIKITEGHLVSRQAKGSKAKYFGTPYAALLAEDWEIYVG